MGRSRLQPAASRCWSPLRRCCQRAVAGSGHRPCSRKWNFPPGRSTRRSSCSARVTSGMVHSVKVLSAASTDSSSSGRSWPSSPTNRMGTPRRVEPLRRQLATDRRRIDGVDRLDFRRVEGNVQTGTEPDLDHLAPQAGDHPLAMTAHLAGSRASRRSAGAPRARAQAHRRSVRIRTGDEPVSRDRCQPVKRGVPAVTWFQAAGPPRPSSARRKRKKARRKSRKGRPELMVMCSLSGLGRPAWASSPCHRQLSPVA